MSKIYHYTSIDTLALILKNKTIRFNRLDNNLDDLLEGEITSKGVKLGNYGFVSCWTEENTESIPLWKLYTNNGIGVRIGLEWDMFKDYHYQGLHEFDDIRIQMPEQYLKTPIEDFFNPEYMVFPSSINDKGETSFYKQVKYVDDVESKVKDCVTIKKVVGNLNQIDVKYDVIGKYKQKHWEFEKEARFFLFIIPGKKIQMNDKVIGNMNQWLYDVWTKNIKNTITDYYMHLKDNIFDDIEIVLSPNCSIANRIIVEALCDKYAPKAKILDSSLKNLVHLKQ